MTRQQIVSSIENGVTDFSNKDLSNLDLGLNFEKFNLSRANLSRANLSGANLSGANLYGANLSDANLSDANLSGASLSGANLSRASLSDANLSRANLYGASLSDAKNIFIFNGISGRTCYAVVFENEEPSAKYLMIKAGCFFDNLSEFKSASKAKGEKYEAQIQYLEILETLLNRK